jgi:hypothetical protein
MSVTPHDDTAAKNASLLVSASACGRDDESKATVTPRAVFRARPSTPELDERIVSTLSWLTVFSSRADDTSRSALRFHQVCFEMWEQERDAQQA